MNTCLHVFYHLSLVARKTFKLLYKWFLKFTYIFPKLNFNVCHCNVFHRSSLIWGERISLGQQNLHSCKRACADVCYHLWIRQRRRAQLEYFRRISHKLHRCHKVKNISFLILLFFYMLMNYASLICEFLGIITIQIFNLITGISHMLLMSPAIMGQGAFFLMALVGRLLAQPHAFMPLWDLTALQPQVFSHLCTFIFRSSNLILSSKCADICDSDQVRRWRIPRGPFPLV